MRGLCVGLTSLVLALASAPAHADDWLAVLPVCAQEDPVVTGPTALLYPRPGLAAVVAPGEGLVTRVRVAAPLTPPPGHQQEKALRGWSAELRGHGTVRVQDAEHRYRLRVADVRPDAHSTLVYRATIRIPPWLAPGTYDLSMQAPWSGVDVAVASVRVTSAPLRFGYLGRGFDAESLRRLSRLAVDIWWVDTEGLDPALRRALLDEPLTDDGLPWVDRASPAAVLRTDAGPVVLGGCHDPHVPFDRARLRTVGAEDARELVEPPGEGYFAIEGEDARAYASLQPLAVDAAAGTWSAPEGSELRLAVPEDGFATAFEGAEDTAWYPATPLRAANHRASIVAVFRADGAGSWTRAPGEFAFEIEGPENVTAGRVSEFRADGADDARVAWGYMEDGAAYTEPGEAVPLRFGQMERQELHALAIRSDGAAARDQVAVYVHSDSPRGCAVAPGVSSRHSVLLVFALWFCTMAGARYARRRSRRE